MSNPFKELVNFHLLPVVRNAVFLGWEASEEVRYYKSTLVAARVRQCFLNTLKFQKKTGHETLFQMMLKLFRNGNEIQHLGVEETPPSMSHTPKKLTF